MALGATEDVERTHALRQTLQGCDRAARLVEQLLTLSRLESGASPEMVEVDVAALARQVVAEVTPRALAKHQDVECRADGRALVRGDTTLLSVLVRNLVDNAVRYSPDGASIRISVTTAVDNSVELLIDDSGPGMTPSDIERAGERFFRVVGSGQSGSGLGLSITRRIADVHRATVRVARSASLGGLCVMVRFARGTGT